VRATFLVLTILQLLLRGVAVPHCHAHESSPSEAEHAERPHIHLTNHSHSSGRNADKHGHSHRHDNHNELPAPIVPSSDHEESAFYVGSDVLTAAVKRVELPAADRNSVLDPEFDRVADSVLPQFVASRKTGPPEGSIFAPLVVLPHMLRL
jgi:hypothetical protein